jgi:hypothetical protein
MVMEPVDMRDLKDRPAGRQVRRPRLGRVLVQGEVRPPLVIVGQELFERASKGPLIPHDDVIEALLPQRNDQALHEWILPR